MTLGVDVSRLQGPRTGVGRYVEYLVHAWARQPVPFKRLRLFSRTPILDLPGGDRLSPEVLPSRFGGIWWQTLRLAPAAGRESVLLSFYTLPPRGRPPSVLVNQGVLVGPYAETAGPRARARAKHIGWSARNAELVVTHSLTTRDDLTLHFGVDAGKVRIIKPGLAPLFRSSGQDERVRAEVTRRLGEDAPYFLFVGKLSPRRHVPALVEAFAGVAEMHPEYRLLLVGPSALEEPVEKLAQRAGVAGNVVRLPYLDLEELALLYRGARALVWPSEREGFGHPILEAMGCGCPVAVLEHASLGVLDWAPEPGDRSSVLGVPSPAPAALREALVELVEDDALHASLAQRGRAFAATFPTWEEHAAELMETLGAFAEASGR